MVKYELNSKLLKGLWLERLTERSSCMGRAVEHTRKIGRAIETLPSEWYPMVFSEVVSQSPGGIESVV